MHRPSRVPGLALRIAAGLAIHCLVATTLSAQLVISEFRVRGPNGANDEFIEIANNSGADHTVAGGGTGYGVAASDGVARCVIPNGTVIPNRGHYLCVNSVGYSLASYPAGNGTTATGDATYTTDIPDNAGIAIFNTSVAANFTLANRLDAVGSTSEANTLYKEGTGYPALTPFSIDYAFYRDTCGKDGSITSFAACPAGGFVTDTSSNAADFVFVDTNGTSAGAGQRLGAPGPENLSAPIPAGASFTSSPLDSCVGPLSPPNRVRDFTSDPANNSTFGTLDFRATYQNNTGGNTTRLRFRVVDLTTFPAPSGVADLRPRTSTAVVVTVDRPPCESGTSNVTVQGTTLEQPPSQPNGGGFNSSLSAGTVTLATPLPNGGTIDLRFLMGIQQIGAYRLGVVIETLPGGGSTVFEFVGNTDSGGDLALAKSDGGASSAPGGTIAWTLTYANPATGVAPDVVLTETVPVATTFNAGASTAGWICTPNGDPGSTCTLGVGNLFGPPGDLTATFAVDVADPVPGGTSQISNTASIAATGITDTTPADNTATDTTPLVLPGSTVSGTKEVSGSTVVGGILTYTITLTNAGPGAQADNPGAELTDVLPSGLALVSASATSGTAVATVATNTVTWDGTIPASDSVTITITATILPVAAGTTVSNQGTVSFDLNGDGTNESSVLTDDPGVGGATDLTTFAVATLAAAAVPTLSTFGAASLALLLAAVGVWFLRGRVGA